MPREKRRGPHLMRLLCKVFLCGVVIYLTFRVNEPVEVAGSSMEPTLHEGQHLLVCKSYDFMAKLQRGDLVVFSLSEDRHCNYVKRVTGVPGDTIKIAAGKVWLNEKAINEPFIKGITVGSVDLRRLGPDEYFVMGDNRTASKDSRHFGPIRSRDILGRAWMIR